MQPLAIHHVSVNVASVEQGIGFYTDVLGGVLRTDRPDLGFGGAWIDFGPQQVHLIEAAVPPNHGQHFAIRVADLDGAVEELRAKHVLVSDPVPVGAARQAFTRDPDGNAIELHEVPTEVRPPPAGAGSTSSSAR
ncbi:MAG TPA: VOC family protein [Acidimicrobiales bacterium]|nr:VOC family protein [Acidimicrobiales bacterium]